jgi:hypothetical protein
MSEIAKNLQKSLKLLARTADKTGTRSKLPRGGFGRFFMR